MSGILLGTSVEGSGALQLSLPRLIETRMLVQANSGGGKSWAIRRLLEQTFGKVQQIVLDVEGEFYTLREKYDYVLAGRKGGDCPAYPRIAGMLATRLLELGASAILDLSEMKRHEQFAFVRLFLEAMIEAPRNLWHPALVVVDEAHLFCPEKDKAESASAVTDICTRGRKRGFCAVLATQRISKLNKDAAAECNNKLIGRATLDIDMKRGAEELGLTTQTEQRKLRALHPGQFFAFGPAISDEVRLTRIGSVETTHPKAGAKQPAPAPPSKEAASVLAKLAEIPREAEEEIRALADAKAKIADLTRELRAAKANHGKPAPDEVATMISEAVEKAVGAAQADKARAVGDHRAFFRAICADVTQVAKRIEGFLNDRERPSSAPEVRVSPAQIYRGPPITKVVVEKASIDGKDGPMQRVVDAVAWLEAAGVRGPYSREQVALLARYAPSGGSYQNALGRLRTAGDIDYPKSNYVALTEQGRRWAKRPAGPTTADELQRRVLETIDGPMKRCLEPLLKLYPDSTQRETLAIAAGYDAGGGSYQNALGRLRTLGAIDYPSKGMVRAEPWLFLE